MLFKCFAANLIYYRKLNHISQEELASRINISPRTIINLENCRNWTTPENIENICKVLNVNYDLLFREHHSSQPGDGDSFTNKQSLRRVLADNIYRYSDFNHISQRQLSLNTGLTVRTLSDIMNCKSFTSPENIQLIADGLGISVFRLFEEYLITLSKSTEKEIYSLNNTGKILLINQLVRNISDGTIQIPISLQL